MTEAEKAEERRRGRLAGLAAIAAGLVIAATIAWNEVIQHDRPTGKNDDAESLRFVDQHADALIAASIVRAIGFGLLVFAILHLHRAAKMRNPDMSSAPVVVGIVGVAALIFGSVSQTVSLADKAADFATLQFPSDRAADKAAEDLRNEGLALIGSVGAYVGTLALGFWCVLGSLNAMRVGLLTRFMGVAGVIIGVGLVFGFSLPALFVWVIALGALFLGYWPRGLPPAWEAGEAIPWPKAGEAAGSAVPETGVSRNGEVDPVGAGVRKPEPEEGAAAGGQPRRKRKRRR